MSTPANGTPTSKSMRCAVYTRKSTEEGLEQAFNSLDAQRQAAEAYIRSQAPEGWRCLPQRYDDGGYSGGTLERPALSRLLADIAAGQIDCVVAYKSTASAARCWISPRSWKPSTSTTSPSSP